MSFTTIPSTNTTKYDERHGGPFDRGSADSYYRRTPRPHYFTGATGCGSEITDQQMTTEEIGAYWAGYDDNQSSGFFKEW